MKVVSTLIVLTALASGSTAFAQNSTEGGSPSGAATTTAPSAATPSTQGATTPSVNRSGDADVRSDNRKGGTGGQNSSNNGS